MFFTKEKAALLGGFWSGGDFREALLQPFVILFSDGIYNVPVIFKSAHHHVDRRFDVSTGPVHEFANVGVLHANVMFEQVIRKRPLTYKQVLAVRTVQLLFGYVELGAQNGQQKFCLDELLEIRRNRLRLG
ncbi:MAG TPA: hypothetical protein VN665_00675 [Candidatus Paceibacterota bacterium]|nr:hypothetical protein [Candidatus Paceibacterota bacterium]